MECSHLASTEEIRAPSKWSPCKATTWIYRQGDQNGLVKLAFIADADFAGEVHPNSGVKASTSYIVLFAYSQRSRGPRWKQEAEYRAAALGGIWIEIGRNFFGELNLLMPDPVALYEDNSACLANMDPTLMGTDICHIDIDTHWIKQQCIRDIIAPAAVNSKNNVADLGTKNTSTIISLHPRPPLAVGYFLPHWTDVSSRQVSLF